jgi:hypothetical protein
VHEFGNGADQVIFNASSMELNFPGLFPLQSFTWTGPAETFEYATSPSLPVSLDGTINLSMGNWIYESTSSFYAPSALSLKVVPIPAAVWLFVSGLGLLGWFRRRSYV